MSASLRAGSPPNPTGIPVPTAPADPVKALLRRHRELCARAVDPLEIAAGLEARGAMDHTAAECRHRDLFSLAEELYARGRGPETAPGGLPAGEPSGCGRGCRCGAGDEGGRWPAARGTAGEVPGRGPCGARAARCGPETASAGPAGVGGVLRRSLRGAPGGGFRDGGPPCAEARRGGPARGGPPPGEPPCGEPPCGEGARAEPGAHRSHPGRSRAAHLPPPAYRPPGTYRWRAARWSATLWLVAYGLVGDRLLTALLAGRPARELAGPAGLAGALTAAVPTALALACATASAAWSARWFTARVRRALLGSRTLAEFRSRVRPVPVLATGFHLAALAALLAAGHAALRGTVPAGPLAAVTALGGLLFLARLVASRGLGRAAAVAALTACATEAAALLGALLAPGGGPLRPLTALAGAQGPAAVPLTACAVPALALLIHALPPLARASAHRSGAAAAPDDAPAEAHGPAVVPLAACAASALPAPARASAHGSGTVAAPVDAPAGAQGPAAVPLTVCAASAHRSGAVAAPDDAPAEAHGPAVVPWRRAPRPRCPRRPGLRPPEWDGRRLGRRPRRAQGPAAVPLAACAASAHRSRTAAAPDDGPTGAQGPAAVPLTVCAASAHRSGMVAAPDDAPAAPAPVPRPPHPQTPPPPASPGPVNRPPGRTPLSEEQAR
ncbi:hypothetical protein [Streptomyces eurocidicus]|uniref:hypothetical protein n=1 Tax=Streptomyces eurocidicus TaxID=66423 RepID=UPI00268A33A9